MNVRETAKIFAVLEKVWPTRAFNDQTIEIYAAAWSDVDYDDINEAVGRYIKTEEFFPSPASLLKLVSRMRPRDYTIIRSGLTSPVMALPAPPKPIEDPTFSTEEWTRLDQEAKARRDEEETKLYGDLRGGNRRPIWVKDPVA